MPHTYAGRGADHVYTCAESSLSSTSLANPVSRVGVPCSREKALSKQLEEKGGSRKERRAEEGRDVRFWVSYSGGNGLNQGLAAPLLTYFDLSSCVGIL